MSERIAKKVLLIGWDAADWVMMNPLIEQGLMPTFEKFMKGGVSGKLATIQPILSPMLWNSIATGKRADKHGIYSFTEPTPDGQGIRAVTSTSRKTKALWNILSQNDLRSIVVGWFASHPAEPIKGAIVTDRYIAPSSKDATVANMPDDAFHPVSIRDEIMQFLVNPHDLGGPAILPFVPKAAEIDQSKDNRLLKLAQLLARASSVHAAACRLMDTQEWDFAAVYYDAIDHFGHTFMPYHPPKMDDVSEEDAELYKDVMVGCYRFHDMMLETLLNKAGEDTTVILVSDHGFHSGEGRRDTDGYKDPVSWHRPFGVVCAGGPCIKKNDKLYGATLLDVTPTILSLFGLPIGGDMDGRPWLEIFDPPVRAETILSWDEVPGEAGMHPEDRREDPTESAEAIRHLVELGYVDAPSDDIQETVNKTILGQKVNLAMALSDSHRLEKAVPLWEELIANNDESKDFYSLQLSNCLMRLKRFDECEAIYREMLQRMPNNAAIKVKLSQLMIQKGEYEQALDLLRQAEEIAPNMLAIQPAMAQAYLRLKQYDEAERAFKLALEADEESPTAYNGLARISNARGEYDKAIDYALHAVGLAHNFPRAHFNLGVALAESGMNKEAIQAFETCVRLAPGIRPAHVWLAKLYGGEDGDEEKARHHALMGRANQ